MTLRDLIIRHTNKCSITEPSELLNMEVIGVDKTSPISLIMYLLSTKFEEDLQHASHQLSNFNGSKTRLLIERTPGSIEYTLSLKEVSE